MRWLQWSTIDLENGLGGVEVHARCLARELRNLGVEVVFSSDPRELQNSGYDVIHLHGSAFPVALQKAKRDRNSKKPVFVHAIHGTTLGRMAACGEWTWVGGYLAALREFAGVIHADLILADHAELWLYKLAKKLRIDVAAISNGWDAFEGTVPPKLNSAIESKLHEKTHYWLFLGRGADPVKNAPGLIEAWNMFYPEVSGRVNLVAVPGHGFESHDFVYRPGVLTSAEVFSVLVKSQGLVLTSFYEGLPLVVLEALGQGVPVVCTPVGGLKTLSPDLQGLVFSVDGSSRSIADALKRAHLIPNDFESRKLRAENNRGILKSWRQVAEAALAAVKRIQVGK
jgi:glycosyltransferase involved in cell wall biosynthesis